MGNHREYPESGPDKSIAGRKICWPLAAGLEDGTGRPILLL